MTFNSIEYRVNKALKAKINISYTVRSEIRSALRLRVQTSIDYNVARCVVWV
jgi:hypothetical protein